MSTEQHVILAVLPAASGEVGVADRAYLDWNATAPLRPQARAAMAAALDLLGNPSSVHAEGRRARAAVEMARRQVAALVGARAEDVVFTSGGTEANTLALDPSLAPRLMVSAVEHASVLSGGRFSPNAVTILPVDEQGRLRVAELVRALAAGGPALISMMLANNETGVIQPISQIADVVHAAGGLLHVDAVQAPGRMACDLNELRADLMTLSSHKIGGPQGVGAVIRRPGLALSAAIRGGGQERGSRAGTENVAGIVGFGAAAQAVTDAGPAEHLYLADLRDRLEQGIRRVSPHATIFGEACDRLPNTTLVGLPGMSAETAVIALDLAGVAVSAGAACSSGKVAASHVLTAMGLSPAVSRSAIRVSLGYASSEADVDCFLNAWVKLSQDLYNVSNPKVFAA